MPEPTAPDPNDDRSDEQPSSDITDSPYTRDRSARDEEVGRTPTPQELAEIRRRTQATSPPTPPMETTAPTEPEQEEPYEPPTPEEEDEIKKRLKLNRIRLKLPSRMDPSSGRTAIDDQVESAIDAYINDENLTEEQQAIIDRLLSE